MIDQFDSLVIDAESHLRKESIPVDALINCISPSYSGNTKKQFALIAGELNKAENVSRVFIVLKEKDVLSFVNYEIMIPIIKLCKNAQLFEDLDAYKVNFKEYIKRRVCETSLYRSGNFEPGQTITPAEGDELLIVTDHTWNANRTLEEVLKLRAIVADIFKIEKFGLALRRIESNCLRLYYYISLAVGELIFPLSNQQEETLKICGICEVHYREFHNVIKTGIIKFACFVQQIIIQKQ